jgi:DNA topoisomerase-1
MAPSKTEIISVRLINNENKFYTHNSKVIFDGYRKVWDAIEESSRGSKIDLNKYQVGATFKLKSTKAIEHTAAPPPHFNQATLVAALEKAGVGRPSTYRQMASVATDRGYAEIKDRAFFMTQLGNEIIENLNKFFSEIINIKLTKEMEEHLDEISKNGEN